MRSKVRLFREMWYIYIYILIYGIQAPKSWMFSSFLILILYMLCLHWSNSSWYSGYSLTANSSFCIDCIKATFHFHLNYNNSNSTWLVSSVIVRSALEAVIYHCSIRGSSLKIAGCAKNGSFRFILLNYLELENSCLKSIVTSSFPALLWAETPPRVNHHSVPKIIRAKCPTATALSFAATTTCWKV